eukprot:849791-Pleurochrysis_carterae.AAC.2
MEEDAEMWSSTQLFDYTAQHRWTTRGWPSAGGAATHRLRAAPLERSHRVDHATCGAAAGTAPRARRQHAQLAERRRELAAQLQQLEHPTLARTDGRRLAETRVRRWKQCTQQNGYHGADVAAQASPHSCAHASESPGMGRRSSPPLT